MVPGEGGEEGGGAVYLDACPICVAVVVVVVPVNPLSVLRTILVPLPLMFYLKFSFVYLSFFAGCS